MSGERREEGVVLLLVLVVIVLTIGSVYTFARSAILEVHSVRHRSERARAEALARSGVEIAIRAIADDALAEQPEQGGEIPEHAWSLVGREPIEPGDGGTLSIRVEDAGSRISINGLVDIEGAPYDASRSFLIAVLEKVIDDMPGRAEEKPYDVEAIADAILDWIDSDDQTRLGDPEATFYARDADSGRPLDRPLLILGELEGIPGVDARLISALEQYFTPYPLFPLLEEVGINPNTAPPHVLATIYHGTADDRRLLGEDEVFQILRARDEGRIFCSGPGGGESCVSFEEEMGRVGETAFPPLQYQSSIFSIRSEGRYGAARVRISAVVDRRDPAEPVILDFRMN